MNASDQEKQAVLSSNVSLEKSFEYRFLQQWLGLGLLTSHGSKWKTRRRLLTPTLHFRILENYMGVFHNQSMILIEKIKSISNEDWIDIKPHIILCTLDIVCETVMGVSIGAQKGSNSDLGGLFTERIVHPWLQSDFIFQFSRTGRDFAKDIKILHDFTEKVIKEKKEKLLKERSIANKNENKDEGYFGKKRETFMDLLLNLHIDGESLSEEDIREEVDTFMFEGHDTTAMGIIFALYCIGLHPHVQEKIDAELHDIFGSDKNRQATQDELRNMKYLECVLKESQRLFPSVPMIGRHLNEDINFDGYTIPKGTTLHLNFYVLHRNPEVFPNPEKFDPDRFLPENSLNRHPYAYIPFSAGPRNCIGQKFAMLEEKIIISNILRNFEVSSIDPRDKLQLIIEFTLRAANPVRLKFIPKK
ncbi:cytochrome P450 4c3-like [Uloborus diversus]|uniref:cytochrome P450 4c3-like n=1 Tax=Uloborus diversus TaxID=327109 RepID=UPI00240A73A3|nr:cytochrome P450 4c3-like [Uloborus diversus]